MRILDYNKIAIDVQNWIKNYISSANADGVIIGISGGIDSSVIAALCVNALGKDKVIGLSLPCESIPQDLEDAKLVAEHLGLKLIIVDLTSCYNHFLKIFNSYINPNSISKANVKPRLRMIASYYMAQSLGMYLVAGTGNRAELAIGYFTKYGDGGVDFEVLGNFYKYEVKKLAKVLKIPEKIINKTPSPGLWPGQTDEGEIGLLYETIDEILYRIDYNLGFEGLNEKNVEKVKNMMKSAKHKLKMPPMFEINKY